MNTPVLVGIAALMQRDIPLHETQDATGLMIAAVKQAAQDAGSSELLQRAQWIGVPQGLWQYSDPARLIKNAVGNNNALTVLAQIGILQQTLIAEACQKIAAGEIECAIVAGSEAKYRQLQAQIQQVTLPETVQQGVAPDVTLTPDAELWLDAETNAGLLMPVSWYAMMESALRAAKGESVADNRQRISERYARFSEIAANNPDAWKKQPLSPEQISQPQGKNKMLAFPYTKAHNADWNVDQASALILCSAQLADELGIAEEKRIYPLASTESNHMQCLSERPQLHRQVGVELALEAALSAAAISVADINLFELYSCFPSAVQMYADALRVADDNHELTVTGGMAFAGGPLNNYVLHATVRMAGLLRQGGGVGLVSSVSGMLTKQAYGLWSKQASAAFRFTDVTEAVALRSPAKTVRNEFSGSGRIAGITVNYQGDQAERAIAIIDIDPQTRCVAYCQDQAVMQAIETEEWVGREVLVSGNVFSAQA